MKQIEKYFKAESAESLIFMAIGVIAILISVYLLFKVKKPFYNGFSYAIILIAAIQIIVGSSIFIRSPKDIERVSYILESEKGRIQSEEIPRMEAVMKNFIVYRWVEIGLIITGAVLFFLFRTDTFYSTHSFWQGAGLGLGIQAAIMLLLDFFAEKRGYEYLTFLKNL